MDKLKARRYSFFARIIMIFASLHFYIGWRLLPALSLNTAGTTLGATFFVLLFLVIVLGMIARFTGLRQAWVDPLSWLTYLCLGLFSSFLSLTFFRDLGLLIPGTATFASPSAYAVIAGALIMTTWGLINARRVAKVVQVTVPLNKLPAALQGFSIVQLSDIHVGSTIKGNYLRAIVDRVNALKPDLIAITGDLVDGSVAQLAEHTQILAALKAKHGVFVVLGNHEYYSGADEWTDEFRRLGLQVLINQHVVIDHNGAGLILAGIPDYSASKFDETLASDPQLALAGSPQGMPRILLAHQPRSLFAAITAGFDLQLSGHTHGGQFWPWNFFVKLQQPYVAGLRRFQQLWVYTSRGTGYWGPPKRLAAPSEITVITLQTAI